MYSYDFLFGLSGKAERSGEGGASDRGCSGSCTRGVLEKTVRGLSFSFFFLILII